MNDNAERMKREIKKLEEARKYKTLGTGVITTYNNLEDEFGSNTCTGIQSVNHETCAVDRNLIPLGSIVKLTFGDGSVRKYKAIDVGGMINGNHIDVYATDVNVNNTKYLGVKIQYDDSHAVENLEKWRKYGI